MADSKGFRCSIRGIIQTMNITLLLVDDEVLFVDAMTRRLSKRNCIDNKDLPGLL